MSFNSELLLQAFRVTFNQGVMSSCFIDVHLIILQVFGRTGGILVLPSTQIILMKAGRKMYLNQVDFVSVGKDSVHSSGHLLPCPGDWEGVKAVTMGVQTHVHGA